jgi:hypothetical protein
MIGLVEIPNTSSLFIVKRFEVVLVFEYKGHDKVNNNWTSESKE